MTQTPSVKTDQPTRSRPKPPTPASGSVVSETATVCKSGQTELVMKETGGNTKPREKENSLTLTATFLRVTGSMTKLTDMVSIYMSMEPSMKVTGKTTFNTDKVKNLGPMAQSTKDTM